MIMNIDWKRNNLVSKYNTNLSMPLVYEHYPAVIRRNKDYRHGCIIFIQA